jgi:hypothetical protein
VYSPKSVDTLDRATRRRKAMPDMQEASFAEMAKWHDANPSIRLQVEVEIDIRPGDLKCDECGKPADTIHFRDAADGAYPKGGPVTVKFACPKHDFGDYWADVKRFIDPGERFPTHIAEKNWGLHGLATLRDRLDEVEHARMVAEGIYR